MIPIKKDDLLEGIDQIGPRIFLMNKFVNITITEFDNQYVLETFYNNNRKIKGLARCALYFLLKELLEGKVLDNNTILQVDTLMPSDKNINKLVKTYENIGFSKQEKNQTITMYSTIGNLLNILSGQCLQFNGGKKRNLRNTKKAKSLVILNHHCKTRKVHKIKNII